MNDVWNVNKFTIAGTKMEAENYRLESRNDEAGVIKRSRGESMEDQK